MGVNKGNNEGGSSNVGSGEQAQRGADTRGSQERAAPRGPRTRTSILEVNSTHRRPVGRSVSGEVTQGFAKALIEQSESALKSSDMKDHFEISVLDNNGNQVPLSVIMVSLNLQHDNTPHALVFSMIVEGSVGPLPSRFLNNGGNSIEIESVASDVISPELWAKIEAYQQDLLGSSVRIHNAGSMVLPRSLSWEDQTAIHRVFYIATQALYSVYEADVAGNERPITVSELTQGVQLTSTVEYNPSPLKSAVGQPIRSDASVVLRAQVPNANNQQNLLVDRPQELTRVDGFINLNYIDPQTTQQGPFAPPVVSPQRYLPEYIITYLDTQTDAITPELLLVGLATTTQLAKNMQWGGVFSRRYNDRGMDMRDIGAIGYEVNLSNDPAAKPARINTKDEAFGQAQLGQLLGMVTIADKLAYSIDVVEGGELSWIDMMFYEAANGNVDAYRAVLSAADNLTEGAFGQLWGNSNAPIVFDTQNRIHLGHYTAEDGSIQDVRRLDYLALLNLYGPSGDISEAIKWSNSFIQTDIPSEIRSETRSKIIKNALPNVTITGYARRLTFGGQFIEVLSQACFNAGLTIRPSNMFTDFTGGSGRAAYNMAPTAVSASAIGGVFNMGTPGYGNFRGMGGPFSGRFGGNR